MPDIDPPRVLTDDERALLDFLVELAPTVTDALRQQAASARVSDVCDCGCGSYGLVVDASQSPTRGLSLPPVAETEGRDDREPQVSLYANGDGRLAEVRINYIEKTNQPFPSPEILVACPLPERRTRRAWRLRLRARSDRT